MILIIGEFGEGLMESSIDEICQIVFIALEDEATLHWFLKG